MEKTIGRSDNMLITKGVSTKIKLVKPNSIPRHVMRAPAQRVLGRRRQ